MCLGLVQTAFLEGPGLNIQAGLEEQVVGVLKDFAGNPKRALRQSPRQEHGHVDVAVRLGIAAGAAAEQVKTIEPLAEAALQTVLQVLQ
jgi:hypothetical protein